MERGLLRWQDVTRTIRRAALRGLFGGTHRVSQLADGSWSIAPEVEQEEAFTPFARRQGDQLYMPHINVGGEPIELGSVPWTADPEPFFDLANYPRTGWLVMFGEIVLSELSEPQPPMAVSLVAGTMPPSSPSIVRVPLALLNGQLLLSPEVRIEG
jgi:hypothetical protein